MSHEIFTLQKADSRNRNPEPVRDVSGHAIFSEGDLGRAHAEAHRALDNGQFEHGYRILGQYLEGRTGSGSEWVHLQFHMAVFELELGYWDEAYARFTEYVVPSAAFGDALTDAPALAWRLWLSAGSPRSFPWEAVRSVAAARIDRRDDPWVDLHNVLALAGAGDLSNLERWIESRRSGMRSRRYQMVVRMAEAMRAYLVGEVGKAARVLHSMVPRIPEIGGSRAQNQLFEQIEAAVTRWAQTDHQSVELDAVA